MRSRALHIKNIANSAMYIMPCILGNHIIFGSNNVYAIILNACSVCLHVLLKTREPIALLRYETSAERSTINLRVNTTISAQTVV